MTTQHIYSTKYALTAGIQERDVEEEHGDRRRYKDGYCTVSLAPGDWHLTREAAVARAKGLRDRKIASLRKQIAKLEKLTFEE